MSILWDYLVAMGLTLAILLGWIGVQRMYRRFAARHPEYGPPRECLGCGLACPCGEDDETASGHTTRSPGEEVEVGLRKTLYPNRNPNHNQNRVD